LREVTFEDGCKLKRIRECAFFSSSIEWIRIPKEVKVICRKSFWYCKNLRGASFEDWFINAISTDDSGQRLSDRESERVIESEIFGASSVSSIIIPLGTQVDDPLGCEFEFRSNQTLI
jgi:hypothetical protein